MALIGGGGAGNVAGGNPSGTGSSLNYIGDHCYAYSGRINSNAASSADATMLDFSTGSQYIEAKLGFIEDNKGAETVYFSVFMDGQEVIKNQYDGAPENELSQPMYLIIPPYTRFQVLWGMASVSKDGCAFLTGRVYG